MNERITKIVIETLGKEGVIDSRAFGHWALSDEQLEKFAELIVWECSQIAHNSHPDDLPFVGGKMLVHFGVEE